MSVAALSWPAASVYIAVIVAIAIVVGVLIWSIFRTGRPQSHTTTASGSRKANHRRLHAQSDRHGSAS
jgi:hypothetical protein